MIIPALKGGVGNQLFQIAAAFAHAKDVNTDFAINYNMQHCMIQGKVPSSYKDSLYKNISQTSYIPSKIFSEKGFAYSPIPQDDDLVIDGYFQSAKYFYKYENELKNLINFPNAIKDKIDEKLSFFPGIKIMLHIRRGDYINHSNIHNVIDIDWYAKILNSLETSNKKIFVCTDSPDIVFKEIGSKFEYIFVNSKDELSDLYCLSRGDYIVGSNSTFSWWAAWLGNHKARFFPKQWFGKDGPQDYDDIFHKDFTIIA